MCPVHGQSTRVEARVAVLAPHPAPLWPGPLPPPFLPANLLLVLTCPGPSKCEPHLLREACLPLQVRCQAEAHETSIHVAPTLPPPKKPPPRSNVGDSLCFLADSFTPPAFFGAFRVSPAWDAQWHTDHFLSATG